MDLEQKPVKVDRDIYWNFGGEPSTWSPDSTWLAYEKHLPSHLNAVYLHSIGDGKSTQVTDGMSDAKYPAFDKDGKYFYFTASTNAGPSMEPDIHSFTRPVTRSIYLVVLAKQQGSPLPPESNEVPLVIGSRNCPTHTFLGRKPVLGLEAQAIATQMH